MSLKPPKGTQDYSPELFSRLNRIIETIRHNAINLGAEEIDTPSMELTRLLLDKYGEEAENKLVYRIEKLGKEELSLRYDLTIPFQRYLVNHGLDRMKRFQVGKVYRKDRPYLNKGRFREFIQADFDIVGDYQTPLLPEAEIMKLITLSLNQLGLKNYIIRINFRENLFSLVTQEAHIPPELFKDVCISIDKLDKKPWSYITEELERDRGLNSEQITTLKTLLDQNYQSPETVAQLKQFYRWAKIFGFTNYLEFDSSLARGLDYYTGLIYEVTLKLLPSTDKTNGVATTILSTISNNQRDEESDITTKTLIAGGRYDRLIKFKNKRFLPAIGVSFGINRLEMVLRDSLPIPQPFKIFVVSQPEFLPAKLKIVNLLLDHGYQVDYFEGRRKNVKQINNAIKDSYQYILIYGEDELLIKVKSNDQEPDQLTTFNNLLPLLSRNPFSSPISTIPSK